MFKVKYGFSICSNCYRRSSFVNSFASSRLFSSQRNDPVDYADTPVKFSQSPAKDYKASVTRSGISQPRLWYEPHVILASIAVFLIYFCVLREENDVDKELGRSLYSRIEGLEEVQLRMSLRYNLDNGLDTTAIKQRLKEIEEEKRRGASVEDEI